MTTDNSTKNKKKQHLKTKLNLKIIDQAKNRVMVWSLGIIFLKILFSLFNIWMFYTNLGITLKKKIYFNYSINKLQGDASQLLINMNNIYLKKTAYFNSTDFLKLISDGDVGLEEKFELDAQEYVSTFKFSREAFKNYPSEFKDLKIKEFFEEKQNICKFVSDYGICSRVFNGSLESSYISYHSSLTNKYLMLIKVFEKLSMSQIEELFEKQGLNSAIDFIARDLKTHFFDVLEENLDNLINDEIWIKKLIGLLELIKYFLVWTLSFVLLSKMRKHSLHISEAHKNFLFFIPKKILVSNYMLKSYFGYYNADVAGLYT